jgi:predicted RNase H-like nuclease (RuvC/YqgF family)
MAHYSIIVPDDLASQVNQEATGQGVKKSTYITQLLREHYEKPASVLEAQIEEQQSLIDSLQSDCTRMQDRLRKMQDTTEQAHLLKASLNELENALTDAQAHNLSLTEKLQQLQASKDVVITGLQHEVELLRQQLANSEATLHTERGHLSELRQDKDTLQKQLELVTLRLPAPKVGFWSRIFGGGRKKEGGEDGPD